MIRPLSQLAEIQEYIDDLGDKRSPEAMFIGEAIVVYTFELIEVVIDQSVKRRVKFPLRSISI